MKSQIKFGKYQPAKRIEFSFASEVRLYDGPTPWYFLNLPKDLSKELDELFADQKRGFGSLRVEAKLNGVIWQTSIFPNSEFKTFMLPLKALVRKQAGIDTGDKVLVSLGIIV